MSDWRSRRHDNPPWPFTTQSPNMIDELLREINNYLLRELQTSPHRTLDNIQRTYDMPNSKRVQAWKPIIYLYDVTFDTDNNPLIHEFGQFKPQTQTHDKELTFNIQAKKEPLIDILTRSDLIQVVVDLPGVKKQDIHLQVTKTVLTIEINSPHSHYLKKIDLPAAIDSTHASSTFKNGVLAVKLPKENPEHSENQSITS